MAIALARDLGLTWGVSSVWLFAICVRVDRGVETQTFRPYYSGAVRDAPACPPQIVYVELLAARERVAELRQAVRDCDSYRPGAAEHDKLARSTLVAR